MAAAAGRNVLRVFRSALLPCGCLEGMSVALVCSGVGSKHADAGVLSVPLALWCLSPAVPNRGGCWHGPWMWFWGMLAMARLFPCNPWHWGWTGSSRAGQDSGVLGVLVGAWVSWMGSILLFISCPNTTGSPACPDITLGAQRGSPGWGFRDQIPCSQPHFQWLEAPDPAGKEESCGVLGIRKGHPRMRLGQALSCPGNRDRVLCLRGTRLIWPVLGSCNQ